MGTGAQTLGVGALNQRPQSLILHLIPMSRGGSSSERNIHLLCESCNRRTAARSDRARRLPAAARALGRHVNVAHLRRERSSESCARDVPLADRSVRSRGVAESRDVAGQRQERAALACSGWRVRASSTSCYGTRRGRAESSRPNRTFVCRMVRQTSAGDVRSSPGRSVHSRREKLCGSSCY